MIESYHAESRAAAVHQEWLKTKAAPDDSGKKSVHAALIEKLGPNLGPRLLSHFGDTAKVVVAPTAAKAEQAAAGVDVLTRKAASMAKDVAQLTQALEQLAAINAALVARLARLEGRQ
ncbi:MAG: hypothetical protein OEM00_10935 [Burkholderiaceae bacterium]|nr:hypothetical protein [Burkholderiaceae bacterium]